MSLQIFGACVAAAVMAADPVAFNLPAPPAPAVKSVVKAEVNPNVSHTYLGEVTGTVVKVGDGSITLKVPELVPSATAQRRPSARPGARHRTAAISTPKATTKMVEVTYDLGDAVSVKTVTGKVMTLADVSVNSPARVHVERLREQKVGEKSEPHVVVKSIDIPVPVLAPIPPAKK